MTQRLMPSHRGAAGKHLPPRHVIDGLVDRTSDANHWLWDGDFLEEDGMRYAAFIWAPPMQSAVWFCVARVMWSYENDASLFHRKLRNTCGLSTCVNPAHFERVALANEALDLVTLPKGIRLGDGAGVRLVRFGDEQHVHILRDDSGYVACYRTTTGRKMITVYEGTPITCSSCIAEWRDFGRPLVKAG
jgi:hypothetical protein